MTDAAVFTELCPGCFAGKGKASLCPHCGYDENFKRGPLVLAHHTRLNHGQYLIGRVLGKPGGFGITYLALDTKLETRVAIKEYLPRDLAGRDASHATIAAHSAEDEEFFRYGLTQFLKEARTLAQFDHANIARVRNFFEENGTGYLVMDYYDGITLADYLAQQTQGRLPESIAVDILMPILDGLREVHAKHILHRDIKPQNIYLTTGNRPILLDFGAARQAMSERSRSLSVVLSEGYAPYEQYHRRGEQGPWTDIYACAAVLYHAVAGEAPPPAIERMHKDELDIGALSLSASLTTALRMGLAADYHDRPQRMTEFQALLLGGKAEGASEQVGQQPASVTGKPGLIDPIQSNNRRSQKAWWAVTLLGIAVAVAMLSMAPWDSEIASLGDVAAPSAVLPAPTSAVASKTVSDDPDTLLWNEVKASGKREQLDEYLKLFPRGKHADVAEIKLKTLDHLDAAERIRLEAKEKWAAEQFRAEQQAWDQAKAGNTPDSYSEYLRGYPKGRYVAKATAAQKRAQKQQEELKRQAVAALRREQEVKQAASEPVRREEEAKKTASEAERHKQEDKEAAAIAKVCSSIDRIVTLFYFDMGEANLQDAALTEWIIAHDAVVGWIRKAASLGNAEAQSCFAYLRAWGLGVREDGVDGVFWARKAAAQGNARGQYFLASCHSQGFHGVSRDMPEAMRLYRAAAAQGHALAKTVLGKLMGDN